MPLQISPDLAINDEELDERFVRASGPGGQNVNKVATAVQLRFDVNGARALTDEVRNRLRTIAGNRITAEGVLVIDARAHRTQAQNRDDARQRLADLIRRALERPKRRQRTKPTRVSRTRRLEEKRRHGEAKRRRSGRYGDD